MFKILTKKVSQIIIVKYAFIYTKHINILKCEDFKKDYSFLSNPLILLLIFVLFLDKRNVKDMSRRSPIPVLNGSLSFFYLAILFYCAMLLLFCINFLLYLKPIKILKIGINSVVNFANITGKNKPPNNINNNETK